MHEVSSKTIDGITDLVVVAPIRQGFITAFENVTYATRLKLGAEALNRVRISAREHERLQPFPDVTERIQNLLDFRIGVLDKDLFGLIPQGHTAPGGIVPQKLEGRRFLYLTATFEGGWEPYMRLIWKPLGTFLDLLFCNCEGYVTATGHSFEEYTQWVRDHQVDSSIFYNTTGLSTRDQRYLSRLERLQRDGTSDLGMATFTTPYPDAEAAATRAVALSKTMELALEALTVLFKLADYYPPEWMTGPLSSEPSRHEGLLLLNAAREILRGWDDVADWLNQPTGIPPHRPDQATKDRWNLARQIYAEPLAWYETGIKALEAQLAAVEAARPADPDFDRNEVQAGILEAPGSRAHPVREAALLQFTVRDAAGARGFIKGLLDSGTLSFSEETKDAPSGTFHTIAMTAKGLLQLGMDHDVLDRFPKEFRDGPAMRSGIMGDMREYHPRNWILPPRNGPALAGLVPEGTALPPVSLTEIDFVIQVRSTEMDRPALEAEVRRLAALAAPGASLETVDWMCVRTGPGADGKDRFRDWFGFLDGISQPRPAIPGEPRADRAPPRDKVPLGEVILGYGNDRGDGAPGPFDTLDADKDPTTSTEPSTAWRKPLRAEALGLMKHGSFLVVRKIGEDVAALNRWLDAQAPLVARQVGLSETDPASLASARALLKAAMMGREADGRSLAAPDAADMNDFDYAGDAGGIACPHASHVRRANPRRWQKGRATPEGVPTNAAEFDRPTPRMVRRGMLFENLGEKPGEVSRGLMFMAHVTSISEQYETVQRWLNGGNSTDVAAANNDPLTGVMPRGGPATFRFMARKGGNGEPVVVRVTLPQPPTAGGRGDEPGRHPFTPLHWMLYLFTPSRSALRTITAWTSPGEPPLRDMLANAVGDEWLGKLAALSPEEAAKEWKRLLEDFDARDPTLADISPHMWAALRWKKGGAIDLRREGSPGILDDGEAPGNAAKPHDWDKPDWSTQNVVICAGRKQVMQVLAQWPDFTVEEQLRRIIHNSGPIYVTQQPDNVYHGSDPAYKSLDYHSEAHDTNAVLMACGEDEAFAVGYAAAKRVLLTAAGALALGNSMGGVQRDYFKLELRRQFILPAIAEVWKTWYGLPDGVTMENGGWSWKRIVAAMADNPAPDPTTRSMARCPGDFLSPSRNSFYPRPSETLDHFANEQGTAILAAGRQFVKLHRDPANPPPPLVAKMFASVKDDEVLARNIIGTMIGAIPPMDASLRNILFEWLAEQTLWRHQAALLAATRGQPAINAIAAARAALRAPISRALCKRPAPDLLYRTAQRPATIPVDEEAKRDFGAQDVQVQPGDLVVVSLVSATQWSMMKPGTATPDGDVSIIFGGTRTAPTQGYLYGPDGAAPDPAAADQNAVHACPAKDMAMGAMTGIMAAMLDFGQIEALPASLIVQFSGWKGAPQAG